MECSRSVKEVLNSNIDDLELVLRQVAEILVVPKSQRLTIPSEDIPSLMLILKDKEEQLKLNIRLAHEMALRQEVVNHLRLEVSRRNDDVAKLHACLKEAETMLTTAIFQANQKLKSIAHANAQKVKPDEVIRYAHRISASNAIAGPSSWEPGRPERPYPLESEMQTSWLSGTGIPGFFNNSMYNPNMGPGPGMFPGPGVMGPMGGAGMLSDPSGSNINSNIGPGGSKMLSPHQQHQAGVMFPGGPGPFGSPRGNQGSEMLGSVPSTPTQNTYQWSSPRGSIGSAGATGPAAGGSGLLSPQQRLPGNSGSFSSSGPGSTAGSGNFLKTKSLPAGVTPPTPKSAQMADAAPHSVQSNLSTDSRDSSSSSSSDSPEPS